MANKSIEEKARTQGGKCKHDFAYDAEKFWCVKCGHTEIRETPTGTEADPLDFKPILNAYGERMHHLNGIVKVYQRKLDKKQMKFTGLDTKWIYELA